jgi:rhodanese-related sulfurtransferase
MKVIIFSLILFAVCSGSLSGQQDCKSMHTDTLLANISANQAHDTILSYGDDHWFVILDVRTPSEYAAKHIQNGVNIDYNSADFSAKLSTLNRSKVYLLHCASGSRSAPVFTMMKNMHFQKVYNMTGGISAWSKAGYPTVTTTAPAVSACDTIVNFTDIPVNETDSVKLNITNSANDVLTFSHITDLSGTRFSTNFDTTITLSGARDYSFYIYYSPVLPLPDSVIFNVHSNGGILNFKVHGTAVSITNIIYPQSKHQSVFNDIMNKRIVIPSGNLLLKTIYSLYDVSGKLMIASDFSNNNVIDYSGFKNGIYFLRVYSSETCNSYKLLLFSQ